MPPKTRYTKQHVVEAAIAVVSEKGMKALTARSVADAMGSSTAPVYNHFTNMDELAVEVINATQKLMLEYTSRPYTDRLFLNMGTGIALFACEHSRLYRALLLEGDGYSEVVEDILSTLESRLGDDTRFSMLSGEERHVLLTKMWTYTHGLASLICVGLIKDCTQEKIVNNLMDVGADVIGATLAKHKQ